MAAKVSFDDVINAIRGGNMTMSAGNLITSGQRRTIRILGEIQDPKELDNFVVKSQNGAVYLKDLATVTLKRRTKPPMHVNLVKRWSCWTSRSARAKT